MICRPRYTAENFHTFLVWRRIESPNVLQSFPHRLVVGFQGSDVVEQPDYRRFMVEIDMLLYWQSKRSRATVSHRNGLEAESRHVS